jgi:predicted ATPase/DNA-binding SARP family transcriptional activator
VGWAGNYSSLGVTGGIWRFGVLGPLVLELDGVVVPVPSGRQRSLLALLLRGGGTAVSRDRLIDELWGERPPATAVSALHVHLSKLRALLDGQLLLGPGGYALAPDGFELDARSLDSLIDEARADPGRAGVLLREALTLFRGDPLCDIACEGSVADWRRELEEKRLHTTLWRIDADLAAGGAGEMVAELERLTTEHPLEERAWGQLMLALYRAGRQGDALEAYQRIRRRLASELGLDPTEQLTGLQQRILERDPTLVVAPPPSASPPATAPSSTTRSSLPRPLTRLVGRERELEALAALIADPDVRLITLIGPGGVGKTRLLVEVARRHELAYRDGAVFVRLERLTDPALVAAEIATALAHRDGTDGPSADGLVGYLAHRELLLVIDNFEHLLDAAALLAELLALDSPIRVLVSSRAALRIRGEQTFDVEPLGLPVDESDAEAAQSDAVQLFIQCAMAADRALLVDVPMMQTIARICRALDGLPLAIELAASRSRALSPIQIADQLARPLLIGQHALRDLPDRQQTLAATIRWSYDLLSEGARHALRSAAVFLGGFTLPALEAIADTEVQVGVDELVEAGLARRQGAGRVELRVLVRAFALEELEAGGGGAEARARHRRYFAGLVAPASDAFDQGGAPGEVAKPLLADHANLRAAIEDAIESGDDASAQAVALGLRPVWLAGMLRQEAQELVDRLLDRFSLPGDREVSLLRAVAFLDYSPSAKAWHRRLAARASEVGDLEALAMATGNLFGQALNGRDREDMRRLRPALLALITPDASPRSLGWTHYFLALDAYVDGRFQSADEHAELSIEKASEVGHEFMLASAIGTRLLSRSARDGVIEQSDLAEALELMRRPSVQPLAAFALWLVARYAAGVAPESAGRWLAHAERIIASIDSDLWPECELRDETMVVLGIADARGLLERTPSLDHAAAMHEAIAWVAGRDRAERAPRELVSHGERPGPETLPVG